MKQKISIIIGLYDTENGEKSFIRYFDVSINRVLNGQIKSSIANEIKDYIKQEFKYYE